jgi:hypothetical protein
MVVAPIGSSDGSLAKREPEMTTVPVWDCAWAGAAKQRATAAASAQREVMKVMKNSVERVSACVPAAEIHRSRPYAGALPPPWPVSGLARLTAPPSCASSKTRSGYLARPAVVTTALAYRCGGST